MNVVFLAGSSELGGAERSLVDVVAALSGLHPEWTIAVILPAAGPLEAELAAIPARTIVLEQPGSLARLGDAAQNLRVASGWRQAVKVGVRYAGALAPVATHVWRMRGQLRSLAPDIVHTNGFKQHVLGAVAAPAKAAVVWHLRDFVSSRRVMRKLLRGVSRRCAVIVANSDAVAREARATFAGSRVERVYNGVDMQRFRPDGPALDIDTAAGWPRQPADVVRIGLVATFARWKGHEVFIQAVASLAPDLPVRAYIIGGGIYSTEGSQYSVQELRDIASRHGLVDGRLGFTGHVTEPAQAMRALDIVVHASTQPEPFGRVIAEAMASGRAVLAADAGGAAEVIADLPEAGYRPGDWEHLARRLVFLVNNPEARKASARRGYDVARQRFDRRRIPEELIPIYESVVGRPALRGSAAARVAT